VFDPRRIISAPRPPNAVITSLRIGNAYVATDSLLKKGRTVLQYGNTSLGIEFNSLNFIKQNKIHYYYRMQGLDKEWHEAGSFNQAVYSHLSPGNYTFMVKAVNAEGVESEKTSILKIRVQPPFWRTWWFLGLVIFVILGILFWLDRLRMQKLRATESIRSRIARSLTEDMSNSISSINISSELAKTKVDTDKERTREYIEQISETSNRMVHALYDMVWSIDPKNDTMADTLSRMKSFVIETEGIYDINIEFDVDESAARLDLDMEHRYELLSIFKEAILNAARHSGARYVQVSIRLKGSRFFMLIEDDGSGFDTHATSLARGINDMRRRAAAINASLYIESEINTGTMVKLEMTV
jgi:signal transduction histidine kinase